MRIYLPSTSTLLRVWQAAGSADPVDGRGYGVTPALREAYREGDLEELEWVAQLAAGMASLRLIGADPVALPLRLVIAADLADGDVHTPPGLDEPALLLTGPVPRDRWASVLADDPGSAADQRVVAAAAAAWRRGTATPDDSITELLDDAEAVELGWYGVQE